MVNNLDKAMIIDFEIKGSAIKFYLTEDDTKLKEAWGDDWNDRPYEHNAGEVNPKYIDREVIVYLDFHLNVYEPADCDDYRGNSPFSKEDFKNKKTSMITIMEDELWQIYKFDRYKYNSSYEYAETLDNTVSIYYGDTLQKVIDDLNKNDFKVIAVRED